ncbi:heat-inducible transcriptional repressor HrcA [Thiohalorhabdus methylotrophus]|uniref:Heat-inducible transcription repressor HrcA n=1 Tax=Thiohalorhabdus methylotrophus TaxID=3242694 RepID=A0ABV4TWQ6_9GAMM
MHSELDARSKQVLKALVRLYIETGAPVGSRVLARECGLDVSAATVRNTVADLEERGLVQSPHTSAGRVPTSRGYRLFVGIMLEMRPLASEEQAQIRDNLYQQASDIYQLYHAVGRLISGRTHYVGLVLVPRLGQGRFRQIQFLTLSRIRILAILVTTTGIVQNRIVELGRAPSESELERAANYLNERFQGRPLTEVKRTLAGEARGEPGTLEALAAEIGWSALDYDEEEELFIEGQGNLLDYPEFTQGGRLRELFEVLEAPEELTRVLEAAPEDGRGEESSGVQLMIGDEVGHEALEDCSVVTASYSTEDDGLGTVAVIGPARMNYAATIPFVDCTARQLSSVLSLNSPPGARDTA